MKVIGIVGSRRRDTPEDFDAVWKAFSEIYEDGDWIVSGGCKQGGDRFAEIIARRLDQTNPPILIHYPEKPPAGSPRWAYTKANYARNTLIARDSNVIIACVAEDRKGGTEDTLKKWQKMNPDKKPILV